MSTPQAHVIAVWAISIGYGLTLITFGALILILRDGEQTALVVDAMSKMAFVGLAALVFIVTGLNILPLLKQPITSSTPPGGVPSEPTTTS